MFVQNEAARIVSGCSKLVSLSDLREECGWELFSERRRKHKLILFFKMVKGFAPIYLSNLVPQLNSDISNYNLRNSTNLYSIACRTSLYKNSFLPSVVDEWNLLPQSIRDLESVSSFKDYLNIDKLIPNKLFSVGKRRFQIIHARLRNKCSSLKHHLLIRKIMNHLFVFVVQQKQTNITFLNVLYTETQEIFYIVFCHIFLV